MNVFNSLIISVLQLNAIYFFLLKINYIFAKINQDMCIRQRSDILFILT